MKTERSQGATDRNEDPTMREYEPIDDQEAEMQDA
jgi:hypothetical protein